MVDPAILYTRLEGRACICKAILDVRLDYHQAFSFPGYRL